MRPVIGFDLDLTLVDSRSALAFALRALAIELGEGETSTDWGVGVRNRIQDHFLATYPGRDPEVLTTRFRELYAGGAIQLATALPGSREAVAAARAIGTAVVITGKYAPNAQLHLDRLGIVVDVLVGSRNGPEKVETLRELGAAVYVGDQVEDIHAAATAQVVAVGVTTGLDTRVDLAGAGANLVIDSLLELPAHLPGLVAAVANAATDAASIARTRLPQPSREP